MAGIPQDVWYSGGLAFECTQCGDCCSGSAGYVWVNQEEINAMAQRIGMDAAEFEQKFVKRVGMRRSLTERPNGDCVFLGPSGCTIYPVRPIQCRTFPFWNEYVRSLSGWDAAARRCPGVNKGRVYTRAEIEALVKLTDS